MVGNLHPLHPKEGDFNYFNSGGPEIIEIPAIFTWLQPNPYISIIEIIAMGPISIISIRGDPKNRPDFNYF